MFTVRPMLPEEVYLLLHVSLHPAADGRVKLSEVANLQAPTLRFTAHRVNSPKDATSNPSPVPNAWGGDTFADKPGSLAEKAL